MLLMPTRGWQWKCNDTYGVLSVSLGSEMDFLTPYKMKTLIPDALMALEFDMSHAKFYIEFLDLLSKSLRITGALQVQLALNATAAHFLLKPQMPKSWFFSTSSMCVFSELGKIFHLSCQGEKARVLVVDTSVQASLVMLLDQELPLSDSKSLGQFECIKVMHDRLHPIIVNRQIVAA